MKHKKQLIVPNPETSAIFQLRIIIETDIVIN